MDNFEIGIIVKPQGIRGELRVLPTTDAPERFQLLVGGDVFVNNKAYKLTNARQQKGIVIVKLDGVNDRNAAEDMVRSGARISIPAEKALPLSDDEYFVRDLVGLSVYTEEGNMLGEVHQVIQTNANDVYVIKPENGEKSFMIPAIKDVVLAVDMAAKKITVRLMDGLLELTV